jgi:hypothetical protein
MILSGKGYLATKTNKRDRILPKPKECLEDFTEAYLCDVRWEVEMSKPDAYDIKPEEIEIG